MTDGESAYWQREEIQRCIEANDRDFRSAVVIRDTIKVFANSPRSGSHHSCVHLSNVKERNLCFIYPIGRQRC